MAKRLISTVLTVVMAAVLLTGCVKVVKIGHEGDLTGQKEFNPGDSVEAIWDSEVIPECEKKAVDVSDILAKYDGKLTEMGEEFDGLKTKAASYYNYAVKLERAKITKVDKDSITKISKAVNLGNALSKYTPHGLEDAIIYTTKYFTWLNQQ